METLYNSKTDVGVDAVLAIPVLPSLLDVVCRITGMGFAAVARVTEGQWIACSVLDSIQFGLQPGGEMDVDTTICREVREHQRPVVISNVAENAAYRDHATPAMYGFQSYISMPILLPDGTFFGTLCAIDPAPRDIDTPEIVGSFKLFADLIAFHLDAHARLSRSEAALSGEKATSELREQFIAVLGHDLRNPLAAVAAGTRMLVKHPERAAEIAGHIQRSIARMAGLIDNVMDFAKGRLGGGLTLDTHRSSPMAPVLLQVIQEAQSAHPDRSIEAELLLEEPVTCDHARIGQVLSNLLGNALTHGACATPIHVRASAREGLFELSVANAGEPIPAATLATLFQPFVRGTAKSGQQGLGLGLYIAAEIARGHGGTMTATSTPAQTCFTLRMPNGA